MSTEQNVEPAQVSRGKKENRHTLLFGVIASAVIIALIALLMGVEIYGERLNGEDGGPTNAADQ